MQIDGSPWPIAQEYMASVGHPTDGSPPIVVGPNVVAAIKYVAQRGEATTCGTLNGGGLRTVVHHRYMAPPGIIMVENHQMEVDLHQWPPVLRM